MVSQRRENSLTIVRFRDLSDNSIEHLPLNLFFSLHAVARIRLSKNLLGELHRSQFFNTRNLRILWVIDQIDLVFFLISIENKRVEKIHLIVSIVFFFFLLIPQNFFFLPFSNIKCIFSLMRCRDASSNKLRNLPESLFLSTTLLVLLDLSCNRISSFLPGIFYGLTMLEELLLGKNRLSVLPVDLFKDLTSLKYLGLEENRLRELPDELFRTQTSLRELNFRSNQLSEISARLLAPLEQLNSLEMSNNKIARVNIGYMREMCTKNS